MCGGKSPQALFEFIPSPAVQRRYLCRVKLLLSRRCPLAAGRKRGGTSVLLLRLQQGSGLPPLCRVLNGKLCTFGAASPENCREMIYGRGMLSWGS